MAAKGKRMAEEPKKHRKQEQVDYNKYQENEKFQIHISMVQ